MSAENTTNAQVNPEVDYDAILKRREKYQHLTKRTNKLNFFIRHSYCAPQLATLPVITLLSVYLNSFYESLGADLAYISFFIALARSLDVMSDPLISYCTDSFRGNYGRRRPFCFAGCWPYAVTLMMLLSPPQQLHTLGISLWFGFCYVAFFLVNAFVAIPYDALGPELTDNYEDRSRLFFVAGMYDGLGVLIAVILPTLLAYVLSLSGSTCDNSSCFNVDGMGRSCMASPGTGIRNSYFLFNESTQTWPVKFNNVSYADPTLFFTTSICTGGTYNSSTEMVYNYCSCVDECTSLCNVQSSRTAYRIVGFMYGCWMIISILNMVYFVKERSQLNAGHEFDEAAPLVPSIFNTMRNRAFMSLLPAWACDAVAQAMLSTMMTFFVQYVIAPEYMTKERNGIDCNNGVPVKDQDSDTWRCKSQVVLGVIIACMLISALVFIPVWLLLTKKFGKRQTWLVWSLSMAVAILLFTSVGEGDVNLAVGLSVIAGVTLGAKFLNDAILADIIDYDEFLTGQRNEATYTMFKSFLPKICAIPASAAPIAILNSLGQVPTLNGLPQRQSARVKLFCMCVTIIAPAICCFVSFFIKLSFPLRSKNQIDMISEGIGQHMMGKPALDPLTGIVYQLDVFDHFERVIVSNFDHFPSLSDAKSMQLCMNSNKPEVGVSSLIYRMRDWAAIAMFFITGFVVAVAITIKYLSDPMLSIIPILAIVCLGLSITFGVVSGLRLQAAVSMLQKKNIPSKDLLDRIVNFRQIIENIRNCDVLNHRKIGQENLNERATGAEREELHKQYKAELASDQRTVEEWQKVIGVDAGNKQKEEESLLTPEAQSLTEMFADSILTGSRPLTVWEVELYAFVREQQKKNDDNMREKAERGGGHSDTDEVASSVPDTDTDSDSSGSEAGHGHGHGHGHHHHRKHDKHGQGHVKPDGTRYTVPPTEVLRKANSKTKGQLGDDDDGENKVVPLGTSSAISQQQVLFHRTASAKEKERERDAHIRSMLEPFLSTETTAAASARPSIDFDESSPSGANNASNASSATIADMLGAAGFQIRAGGGGVSWDNISLPSSVDDDEIKSEG